MENRTSNWTFLGTHTHVLLCLADDPAARLRDVAARVGLTERAVQTIVNDLEAAAVITRMREGRRNHYRVHPDAAFEHPLEVPCRVGDLLAMVRAARSEAAAKRSSETRHAPRATA